MVYASFVFVRMFNVRITDATALLQEIAASHNRLLAMTEPPDCRVADNAPRNDRSARLRRFPSFAKVYPLKL